MAVSEIRSVSGWSSQDFSEGSFAKYLGVRWVELRAG